MGLNLDLTPKQIGNLVRMTREGQVDAFARLVDTHGHIAAGVAKQQLPRASDVDDVVQEAFIRAYRRLNSLRSPESFTGWFLRIVINVSCECRRRDKITPIPLENLPEISVVESPVEGDVDEREKALLRALSSLPSKYAIPLSLRYLEAMPYSEIAERLGISEVGARARVHRARQALARRVGK